MDDQKESSNKKFIALLENFSGDVVTFEYLPGTHVSELIAYLQKAGVLPKIDIWQLLCQDEEGGYTSLEGKDEIPLKPPLSNQHQSYALPQEDTSSSTQNYSIKLIVVPLYEAG